MSTPDRRRSRPTRAETRRVVLDAAAVAFEAHGFDRASLDDIAASAGLTKGAIYSSFRTKEELFMAVMDHQVEERIGRVTDALADVTARAGATHALADVVTAATYRDPGWHVAFLEFWAKAMRTPAMRQSLADQRRRVREVIAEKVQRHADALGIDLPLPPAAFATTILALSNGLAVEQLLDSDHADPALLDDILSALFSPAAPGRPRRRRPRSTRPR